MTQERREYNTGAVRSADCEQTRYDLISPIGIERLARTYAEGAAKFGAFNWENGMPVGDLLNHALAHIYKFLGGNRDEDHLAHAAWNLLGAIHSLELWPDLNQGYLRGTGCTCPPIAKQPETEIELEIQPVAQGAYSVGLIGSDAAAKLEQLRQAILSKPE